MLILCFTILLRNSAAFKNNVFHAAGGKLLLRLPLHPNSRPSSQFRLSAEPEPTEIPMLPPDPEADKPPPIATAPLVSLLAVPLLKVKALDTPKAPACLVDADTCISLLSSLHLVHGGGSTQGRATIDCCMSSSCFASPCNLGLDGDLVFLLLLLPSSSMASSSPPFILLLLPARPLAVLDALIVVVS